MTWPLALHILVSAGLFLVCSIYSFRARHQFLESAAKMAYLVAAGFLLLSVSRVARFLSEIQLFSEHAQMIFLDFAAGCFLYALIQAKRWMGRVMSTDLHQSVESAIFSLRRKGTTG